MNHRTPKVRDTYRAEVWLNAAQVSFLDSLYPDQELAIQVGLLVRDEMRVSRRNVPSAKPDPIASQGTVVALRPAMRPAMVRPTATDGPEPSNVPVASAGLREPSRVPAAPSNVLVAPNVLEKAADVPEAPSVTSVATPPKVAIPPKKVAELSKPPSSQSSSSQPSSPQPAPAQSPFSKPPSSTPAQLQTRPSLGKIHPDNPISQLQEICHKHQVRLPDYTFGHCEAGFSCECRVKVLGKPLATTGSGPNKKVAKRNAAIEALKALGYS
ncbi:MAG: double-stranded RNA binding motif domain-containing protein [Cyanobacteria bacterium P01_H01_bin.58]